jgi:hypothetical protein
MATFVTDFAMVTLLTKLTSVSQLVGIATTLRGGRSAVRIPIGAGDFSLLRNFNGSVSHPVSYSMGTAFGPRE